MASSPTVNINGNLNINNASVKKSASQVQSAFNNIKINPQSLDKFGNSLGRITGNASEFQKSMDAATARVFAFGATAAVIQTINQSFKALLTSTIQVEKRLVEINSILGASEQQFSKFRKSIFDVAKNTEQSFSIVADGAAELARQGLNAEETAKRLNAALVLTRISGLDSVSSVNALTAAINGYTSAALNAEQIVNKLVAVDTAFAVSAKDLADGFQRAGSTAEDAGVSFDELLGLITAVQQKTARGGAVIGNAFKSIFTRLSRSTTISELQELGVAIDSSQSGVQKLEALSNALSKISDPTQASKIKELAGGVFQINVVSAALKDLSSETSLFAQASDIAAKASNEAFAKNEALNKTLSTQINALVVGLTNVAEKVGQITLAPVISDLVSLANKLTSFLDNALSEDQGFSIIRGLFEGIGKFIQGPGLILITGAFLNIFKIVSKFAIQGFKDLSNLGKGQEKIKSIEQGIVSLLVQDVNLRKQLANASLSQSQKEELVLNAIKQENALLREQQAIVSSLAAASARRGVASFSPSGGFKGKKGKRFAGGFAPEDGMMEVMEAVSLGASPSVKPQMGQGTIGGKKFLMNSQEVELPNFGMNGDSAVIPLYASGHLPRFALGKNPTQISKMNASGLATFMGTKKFGNVGRGSTKADRDAKAAALRRKRELGRKAEAAPLGTPENRLPIDASKYGYLIPDLKFSSEESDKGTFESNKRRVSYNMTGVSVRGPLIPDRVDKAADPEDEEIKKNIKESILDASHRFAKVISPNNKGLEADIKKGLNENRGAKGAVRSAVGSAFEVASLAALGIKEAAVEKNSGDFDVRTSDEEKLNKLRTLFNSPEGTNLMDFKVSASKGNLESFAKKIYNNDATLRDKVSPPKVKTLTKGKGKASGFMPRFARGNPKFNFRAYKKQRLKQGSPASLETLPQNLSPQPSFPRESAASSGGGFDSGKGFAASFAITTALGFVDQGISSSSIKKVDELNRRLEGYKERLKGINKESRPEAFEEMRKSIGDLTTQIEEATEKSDSFSETVNTIGSIGSIAPTLASFAPKGSGKAISKALRSPLGKGAARGAAALGGKALVGVAGAGTVGIGMALGARKFAGEQFDETLASVGDEDFSKEVMLKKYTELLNPLETISKVVKDENAGFLEKAGKIVLVASGFDAITKSFGILGASLANVEEALPREEVLSKKTLEALERGDIREVKTPEEAEAEVERLKKERKKKGPTKFADPKKQAMVDRMRRFADKSRMSEEEFAAKRASEQTKTFGAFTGLNNRPTLSRRDATFNRIGFGGAQSQIAQKIASNQLNTNIKDLSGMEQVKQAKKRQAKDVSLRRQQSSIEFSDSIQVFNQGIKESLGKMDRAGTVTGAGAIQKVEQARQTAIERGFLSDALSEAALTFKKSSDPEALKEAFEQADLRLDAIFKSGSISEEERDKFRTMLENNLSEQSAILNQDVMDRKQLAIDSLKARVQAEEGIVNKLKASFESNLGKLDSNSSQVAADFSQTKTRSERDQFLKNLGISDEGRYQAAVADTTTAQFGQAAVAGAGTELRDYIKEIRASDPEGAEARLQKQFSSGQKQVLSEAVESSNIEGLKKRLFDLQGAKTARGGSFTTAGVTGLINNVSSAGLGDISSVADAERALNVLDAVSKSIGGLSGTKEQTQAQNEIGVQIAALKEKIEAGIGVAKVGIQEQQLATLKEIADNTAKEIAGQKEEGKTPAQKAAQEADKTKTPNMPTPEESRAKMMQKLEQAANDLLEQNKDLASGQRSASEALAMSAEEMAKALASGAISITETFENLPRPAGPQTQTAQPQNEP